MEASAVNKKLKMIAFMIAFSFIGLMAYIYLFLDKRVVMFEQSIAALFRQSHIEYKVLKSAIDDTSVDVSGIVEVIANNDFFSVLINKKFDMADRDDLIYFKKVVKETLSINGPLDEYRLYRSEMVLGENTLCEVRPCDLYMLYSEDNDVVYIGLYKN